MAFSFLHQLSVHDPNNSKLLDLRNIILQDSVPAGLAIEEKAIAFKKGKADSIKDAQEILLEKSKDVSLSKNNNSLVFTIQKLAKEEKMQIIIPSKVDDKIVKTTDFVNTACVTEVEGLKTNIPSKTTYHRVTKTYSLKYVVKNDAEYGAPTYTLPTEANDLNYDQNYNLAAALSTKETVAKKDGKDIKGTWKFLGWYAKENDTQVISQKTIKTNETVYGQWKFIPNITIRVTKVWVDDNDAAKKRPTSVTVKLQNGTKEVANATLIAKDNWTHSFTELPKVDAQGQEITYSIEEKSVPDYTATYKGDAANGFTITNKIVAALPDIPYIPSEEEPAPTTYKVGVVTKTGEAQGALTSVFSLALLVLGIKATHRRNKS